MARRRGGALLLAAVSAVSGSCGQATAQARAPRNFIFFGLERSRISDERFLAIRSIAGARLKYTWRELEPERDRYDLRPLRDDLRFLARHGKPLFVQLQDLSFTDAIVNVPDYLLDDPAFHGGVARKDEFEDDDDTRPVSDGWVARCWDPAVRARLAKLLRAIAREFDGQLAGLSLAETSIGFGRSGALHPDGFTYEAYFEGIKDIMASGHRRTCHGGRAARTCARYAPLGLPVLGHAGAVLLARDPPISGRPRGPVALSASRARGHCCPNHGLVRGSTATRRRECPVAVTCRG
jgi:hypothetical protein